MTFSETKMQTDAMAGSGDMTVAKKDTKKASLQDVLNSKKMVAIFIAAAFFQLTDMFLSTGDQGSPEHLGIYMVVCLALYMASDWNKRGSSLKAIPVPGGKKHSFEGSQQQRKIQKQ